MDTCRVPEEYLQVPVWMISLSGRVGWLRDRENMKLARMIEDSLSDAAINKLPGLPTELRQPPR